jgi:hypothetical protein
MIQGCKWLLYAIWGQVMFLAVSVFAHLIKLVLPGFNLRWALPSTEKDH